MAPRITNRRLWNRRTTTDAMGPTVILTTTTTFGHHRPSDRIDEDRLLAEAVLAYAASVGKADDVPTTYQQAMDSDDTAEWVKAMKAELRAHEQNGSWTLDAGIEASGERMEQDDPSRHHEAWLQELRGQTMCVYVTRRKGNLEFVCLYDDDMIIAAKTSTETQDVKKGLEKAFKMKELGKAKSILGMEIDHQRSANSLTIKQTRYIDDVVERLNQQDAKAV
ncbi:retrotransposon ty1-copia subclass [Plasmopara halstedii]|uniref:Retrotransposon ty1-copia subclass n=1 Tax=Plasmopara halstedii TaxID=4781 RepID=A0A0P1B082_PLAHL|nr:retrotransposon ty1-copia subclass [Plasmopara halstedii]CEG46639.1 retrotransposon ty1-copia subclass [Plasmopara halstedii]|eukprot:XP_024583008.1 retrotransposon ty1-copia subclass [Plasmopara halstedii]